MDRKILLGRRRVVNLAKAKKRRFDNKNRQQRQRNVRGGMKYGSSLPFAKNAEEKLFSNRHFNNRVEPEDIRREVYLSREQGRVTEKLVLYFAQIIDGVLCKFTYRDPFERKEVASWVMEKALVKWNHKLDPEHQYIHSWYTKMFVNEVYEYWRTRRRDNGQTFGLRKVSLSGLIH